MPKPSKKTQGQIYLFPSGAELTLPPADPAVAGALWSGFAAGTVVPQKEAPAQTGMFEVVLSGTYRKDFEGLRRAYEELKDLGCEILSPSNVTAVREENGFVYMSGEETQAPEAIENRHLDAIQKSRFVWLHAPEGYVGPTAALEVGFAKAIGVPVFSRNLVSDAILQGFVQVVGSPSEVIKTLATQSVPSPAIQAFQHYYRRAAVSRGYGKESARDCLLLMVEEVGELARALRKRAKLERHEAEHFSNEAQELADVFLYVIHMANVLGINLADAVKAKEYLNLKKFLSQHQR